MFRKVLRFLVIAGAVLGSCLVMGQDVQAAEGTRPIYRVYNPNSGEHLFTAGLKEADNLAAIGWTKEGISWYAPESGTPVYRLYLKDKFHLYTSDENEVKVLTSKPGWSLDGNGKPAFYAGGGTEIYRLYHPKSTRHLLTADKNEYNVLAAKDWQGEGIGMYGVSVTAGGADSTTSDGQEGSVDTGAGTGSVSQGSNIQLPPVTGGVYNPTYVKGVWISFLEWQEYLKGKNEPEFRREFEKMCDTSVAKGCNTIYVHVRSHNDAVYPSEIYPWSSEMLLGIPWFNPLSTMIEVAHSKGLSFQAWINPYGFRNGEFAGDPAIITKENIVEGVREIVSQYNVDGIHFDDYFPDYDKSVHNELIREVYATCHSYGKIFGISPQGNISNNRAKGVDIDTWLSVPGYIDYLAPQIYWTDQYGADGKTTMFSDRLKAWTELNKLNLPMYVGLATYRCGNTYSSDPGWVLSNNNLATQIQKADSAGWDGYIHFRYSNLTSDIAQQELANIVR